MKTLKHNVKFVKMFDQPFIYPKFNFGPLKRRQPHSPDINYNTIFKYDPKVAGSLGMKDPIILTKRISEPQAGILLISKLSVTCYSTVSLSSKLHEKPLTIVLLVSFQEITGLFHLP